MTSKMLASPTLPGRRVPRSGRRIARAAFCVAHATTSGSVMPSAWNLPSVCSRSKAGPLIDRMCTSDEITSGWKPAASIARQVAKPHEPAPWPMSKITPRSRAARTSGRTPPPGCDGALGNGRKQCVRMSPGRRRPITSARDGGGWSRCAISGRPVASATSSAMSSGAMPELPLAPRPTRTLMPTIRSACACATRTHSPRSSRRRSSHSPTITVFENAKMPANDRFSSGRIRTGRAGSITCLRNPGKLPGPAVPASTKVAVALVRASATASTPIAVPPQYTCVCRSIRPGVTTLPRTSRTSVPGPAASCSPMAATTPPEKCTSATRSMPCDGSITRAPRRIRSWEAGGVVIRCSCRRPAHGAPGRHRRRGAGSGG